MSLLYDDIYDDLAKLETRQPSYATIQTIVCRLKLSVRLYLMWFTHISGFRFGNKASMPYVCMYVELTASSPIGARRAPPEVSEILTCRVLRT